MATVECTLWTRADKCRRSRTRPRQRPAESLGPVFHNRPADDIGTPPGGQPGDEVRVRLRNRARHRAKCDAETTVGDEGRRIRCRSRRTTDLSRTPRRCLLVELEDAAIERAIKDVRRIGENGRRASGRCRSIRSGAKIGRSQRIALDLPNRTTFCSEYDARCGPAGHGGGHLGGDG